MPRFPRTTTTFEVTVVTYSNIFEKYHNFRYNWATPQEFVDSLVQSFARQGQDEDGRYSFGYRVSVKQVTP